MKILKLHFKNINSLKGEHRVHFDQFPLASAGIFAITGNTGSGKTTLLDVISLALFNRIPRLDSISKNEITKTGSILTQHTEEAFASVTYQCREGIFVSSWSIRKARTGTLQDYHMEVAQEEDGYILTKKKSEAPTKNEELIGLNYDQFVRSMMLAQGEFTKFLKSKKEEKDSLLEKITGTEIYRRLGMKAFEKSRDYRNILEKQEQNMEQLENSLLPEEDYQQGQEDFKACEKEIKDCDQELNALTEALRLKKEIKETAESLEAYTANQQQAAEKLRLFDEEYALVLSKHRDLLPYREQIQEWDRLERQIGEQKEEAGKKEHQIASADKQRQEVLGAIAALVGEEVSRDSALSQLEQFRDTLSHLHHKLDLLDERRQQAYHHAELLGRKLNENLPGEITDAYVQHLLTQKEERERGLEACQKILNEREIQEPGTARDHLHAQAYNLREISNFISQRLQKEKYLVDRKDALEQKNIAFRAIPEEVQAKKDALHQAEKQLQALRHEQEKATLRAKYEEDRKRLVRGEACFLCGSTEHPYVEHYQLEAQTELRQQIEEAEKEVGALTAACAGLSKEQQNLKEGLQQLEQEVHVLEEDISSLRETEATQRAQIDEPYRTQAPKDGITRIEAQIKKLDEYMQLSAELNHYQSLYSQCLELLQFENQLRNQHSAIKKLYQGSDYQEDCHKLKEQLQEQEGALLRLQEQHQMLITQLQQNQHAHRQLEQQSLPPLQSLGYEAIPDALPHLLPGEAYERLQAEQHECKSDLREISVQVNDLQNRLEGLSKEAPEHNEEVLMERKDKKQLEKDALNQRRDQLLASLQNHRQTLEALQKARDEYEKEMAKGQKWRLLGEYIGDSQGKKFSNFAQQLTLQQLVAMANHRLQNLSDRYTLDIPRQDDDHPEDDTLVIIDHDMGGIRRSVRTLSGGETFLVSLALALGLSDLASRNVDIQSLFIDEGFGTLDPETLDQTLDTLEKLQAEDKKTIGVISHVNALKDRISTRIEVHKNGQGHSRLHIVSPAG